MYMYTCICNVHVHAYAYKDVAPLATTHEVPPDEFFQHVVVDPPRRTRVYVSVYVCVCVCARACVCVCVCVRMVCVCARARARMRVRARPPRSTCECGCYKCAGGRLRLLHRWKVCGHVATACIREERRKRPALLLLADDAHLGFCLSLSGLPWSLLRMRLLQMCRRPSADATSVNAFKRSHSPEPKLFQGIARGWVVTHRHRTDEIQLLMEITQPPRTAFI